MPNYDVTVRVEGQQAEQRVKTQPSNMPLTQSEPTPSSIDTNAAASGASKRLESTAEQYALSPLNSATGGLAQPTYNIAKAALQGKWQMAGGSAIGLAVIGTTLAIQKINERVAKLENEAQASNNRDNLLLLAGSQTAAIEYKSGFFRGVYKTNRS